MDERSRPLGAATSTTPIDRPSLNGSADKIADHHLEMLAASGITPEFATLRGYETISDPRRLAMLGIAKAGERTRGLLVPQRRKDGSVSSYQFRPDSPRERRGKIVKYETPVGQANHIDVPPGVGDRLGDPAVPLWITEGVKKADCGALRGLCIVALPGVWSWRGKNGQGGTVAVGDWNDIALNGRRVILAFDGDIARKPEVRRALDALAVYLKSKGAHVEYLHLPDTDEKTGVDDYLMAGHTVEDLLRLVHPTPPPLVEAGSPASTPSADRATDVDGSTGSTGLDGSNTEGVLNRLRDWLERFIYPMAPRDLDLLALWIAHSHLANETYTTPRLLIESPVPESGKTTVIEHLERLCRHPMQMSTVSSPAMLARALEKSLRTFLIDEADRALDPDKPGIADITAVLNSGYKRGATRPVLVPIKGGGWDVVEMPTFAPVAMAGNQPKLADDTLSRTIRMLIMPDHEGTVEDSDWELIEPKAKGLAEDLAAWADLVRDQVRKSERPSLPEAARARTKERWLPLKRVAVAAGDKWPTVVDELVELDLERMRLDKEEGIVTEKSHVTLLRHISDVWVESEGFHSTDDLISMLIARYPTSWGSSEHYPNGLTAQRMGRMLVKGFGVYSKRTSLGARGYFAKSFDRALASVRMPSLIEPSRPVDPVEPSTQTSSTSGGNLECPCGRPGLVSHETGLCQWCELKASKQPVGTR